MRSCKAAVRGALLAGGAVLCLAAGPSLRAQEPESEVPENVVRILRTSNKAQINRYVGKVYDFENVNPGAINNYFHSALFREEGAAYTFVAPDEKSGKLLVICPEHQIPYFDQIARELDRNELTSAPGSLYIYKQLNHRSAADNEFLTVARQYASANSVVLGDVETNAVFCFDAPSGSEYLTNALDEYLDQPTPVVKIKVTMYEVAVNNDGTLGLDYEDFKNGPYQNMLVGIASHSRLEAEGWSRSSNNPSTRADASRRTSSQYGLIDIQYPSAYFDFLVQKGKARVVTETQLATSSSEPASLFSGEQVLYYAETVSPDDPANPRQVSGTTAPRDLPTEVAETNSHDAAGVGIQALDAGVQLSILPIVGENSVDLSIDAAVVSLLGFDDSGSPMLSSRRANTEVSAPYGEEIVLGGMVRERQARTSYKMPILGKLPVIGWIFGGETDILQKSMLVIVLQPDLDAPNGGISERAQDTMAVVSGEQKPDMPKAAYGFDMYLLDTEGD